MEIVIKAKTANIGVFQILFDESDSLRNFFYEILKRLQFADMQNAIDNPGTLFADINKHYNKQFELLEKVCFYSDFDNLILSDYAENNVFKTIKCFI